MTRYETKDSGERQQFDSGMRRDTQAGKARFDLMIPEGVPYEDQLLTRFALLLSRGAEKYDERNWEKANSKAEIDRAKSSAFRHFMQWLTGERDEDHAAAVLFNIMVVDTTQAKLDRAEEQARASAFVGKILEARSWLGGDPVVEEPQHGFVIGDLRDRFVTGPDETEDFGPDLFSKRAIVTNDGLDLVFERRAHRGS